eukprot:10058033-Ditylum_brightwellii.AAC.1
METGKSRHVLKLLLSRERVLKKCGVKKISVQKDKCGRENMHISIEGGFKKTMKKLERAGV